MRLSHIVSVFMITTLLSFAVEAKQPKPIKQTKSLPHFVFDCDRAKYNAGQNAGDDAHCVREAGEHNRIQPPAKEDLKFARLIHSVFSGFQVVGVDSTYMVCKKKVAGCQEYSYPEPGVTVQNLCVDFNECYDVDLAEPTTKTTK